MVCADIAKNVFPFSSGGGLFRRLSGFDFLQAGGIWNAPLRGWIFAKQTGRLAPVALCASTQPGFYMIIRYAGERKIAFFKGF